MWGGHTILAPRFLIIHLVLLLHGFPGTFLVLPLVSQTFLAEIPFFIGGILVVVCFLDTFLYSCASCFSKSKIPNRQTLQDL